MSTRRPRPHERAERARRAFPRTAARVGLALAALAGCVAHRVPSRDAAVLARKVTTTDGAQLAAACTPTGPELCFNANDDNCNGVIDEGCGLSTGLLQFMVAWAESPADVDLAVVAPDGTRVHKQNRSGEGLQFERNCPDDDCHGQNVENIYFDGVEPARGSYAVEVKLADVKGAELPVRVRLSARLGSRSYVVDLTLSPGPGTERKGLTFEL